jgi:tRNA threonylcarbamoyladenosine biosynthesis protein TsaB
MLVLGIETSSRRGSVALADGDRVLASASHDEVNAHAERLLPLLEQVLAEAGLGRADIERVAVGVGPGSFTGLRVGIAFGQGLALGLGIPVLGVGSLASMAAAGDGPLRLALLDARRGEVFVAAYDATGNELMPPLALPRQTAIAEARARFDGDPVLLGEVAAELPGGEGARAGELEKLPHAIWTARLGARLSAGDAPAEPHYARDAGAVRPRLPPSPLASPRSAR